MKPKSLTKRDPAITTHEEKARAYGLYELGGRYRWPRRRRLASSRSRNGRTQPGTQTKSWHSFNLE